MPDKLFTVTVKEIHNQFVDVRADNEEDAIRRVADGEGIYSGETEYVRNMDRETWDVLEIEEE